ncbi:MAG: TonB-dependent receptor [Bacteroidota bacterium]
MYKHLIIVLLCALGSAQLYAQGSVSGRIIDENGDPLPSATVMLTAKSDSVLAAFAMSNSEGNFKLSTVDQGAYFLQVTFLEYEQFNRDIEVGKKAGELALGDLTMLEKSTTLDDVEITDERIPIRIKGDTVEYDAKAFTTRPNSNVEDLLKRLPGVEVDQDGNIKAQGESVTKILVDGKEFFGDDPKVASKNLPAEAVDKVQVFDKMSEIAEFTGIDDGERNRTINLALKEDYKTGYFGNVMGGYGTQERFEAKANINRFSETSQLSFLGMANNINEQPFSIQDYITFMGGLNRVLQSGTLRGGGMFRGGGAGNIGVLSGTGQLGSGINTVGAGGLNFNQDFGKKTTLQSSYFYNYLRNDLTQRSTRENILEGSSFLTNDTTSSQDINHNHRLNLRLNHKIDSLSELLLIGSGRYNLTDGVSSNDINSLTGAELQNRSRRDELTAGDLTNLDSRLQYRRKFRKRGRALVVEGTAAFNGTDQEIDLQAVNTILLDTFGTFIDTLRQDQQADQSQLDVGGKISYTEPIGKRKYLEFNYTHQESFIDLNKDFFNVAENGAASLDSLLSNRYDGRWRYDQAGANFRLVKKKFNLNLGLNVQRSALDGTIGLQDTSLNKTFFNVLPSLRWRWSPSKASRMRFNYTARVNAPTIEELQPVLDNSNPFNLYIGNPDLEAETAHNLRLNYFFFDMFSFTGFFASLNATYTQNKISQATTVDSSFRQLTTPINVDNDLRINFNANFNTPIRALGVKIGLTPTVTYNRAITFINDVENPTNRLVSGGEARIENRKKNWLDAVGGVRLSHNLTTYAIDADMNQTFLNTTYFADVTATFLKNTNLNTRFDYTVYSGGGFNDNVSVPLWRASLSKTFLGNDRAELKASVFDLLNLNRGISRTTEINYLEETRANALGRYYMLSFTYKIISVGKKR